MDNFQARTILEKYIKRYPEYRDTSEPLVLIINCGHPVDLCKAFNTIYYGKGNDKTTSAFELPNLEDDADTLRWYRRYYHVVLNRIN